MAKGQTILATIVVHMKNDLQNNLMAYRQSFVLYSMCTT